MTPGVGSVPWSERQAAPALGSSSSLADADTIPVDRPPEAQAAPLEGDASPSLLPKSNLDLRGVEDQRRSP